MAQSDETEKMLLDMMSSLGIPRHHALKIIQQDQRSRDNSAELYRYLTEIMSIDGQDERVWSAARLLARILLQLPADERQGKVEIVLGTISMNILQSLRL